MKQHSQRGGTATGFIIGLVIGLAVALAVAIYVTKVPTPFTNKTSPDLPTKTRLKRKRTKTGIRTARCKTNQPRPPGSD